MSFHLSPRPGAETGFSFRGPVVSVRELQWPRRRAIRGTARRVHPCPGCSWFSPPTPRSAGCTEGLSRPPTRLAEEEFDATVKTKAHRAPEPGPRFPASLPDTPLPAGHCDLPGVKAPRPIRTPGGRKRGGTTLAPKWTHGRGKGLRSRSPRSHSGVPGRRSSWDLQSPTVKLGTTRGQA